MIHTAKFVGRVTKPVAPVGTGGCTFPPFSGRGGLGMPAVMIWPPRQPETDPISSLSLSLRNYLDVYNEEEEHAHFVSPRVPLEAGRVMPLRESSYDI